MALVNKFQNDDEYINIPRPLYANLLHLKYVDDNPLEPTENLRRNITSVGKSINKDLMFEAHHIRILIENYQPSNHKSSMQVKHIFIHKDWR